LIDFRELEGEHSGANMSEAVWETLTRYGVENRVSLNTLQTCYNGERVSFADHGVYVG
jgi:hypothetical protein